MQPWVAARFEAEKKNTYPYLVRELSTMFKIEFAVTEEIVETTEQEDFELSLTELDMVGGGSAGYINA